MPDAHLGVVTISRDQLASLLRLPEKERVTRVTTIRRSNPPFLMFDTSEGKMRHELRFGALAQKMSLPPMHTIHDVWFDGASVSILIEGKELPMVRHGGIALDVPFKITDVEEKPGRPSYRRAQFTA